MLAIIDYGMGNLHSVQKGLEKAGYQALITGSPGDIARASGLVLPGVGAFEDAMNNLTRSGLVDVIKDAAREGKPLLGICLGMQLLFTNSEENGRHRGLDLISGQVVKFNLSPTMKVPHMGWNQIENTGECQVLKGIPSGAYFYFVHSYYVVPDDARVVGAVTNYGLNFTSVVGKENIFGVQFHPEKSSEIGLQILKNFGELVYS